MSLAKYFVNFSNHQILKVFGKQAAAYLIIVSTTGMLN